MNEFDKFLSGTRKELVIQLAFTLFAIVIRDQLLQLIVLGIGFLVVCFLIWARSGIGSRSYGLSGLFVKYVVVQGLCYVSVLLAWIWGGEFMEIFFDLDNGFLGGILLLISVGFLIWFTMLALTRPTLIFGGEGGIGELFWIVGLVISLNLPPEEGYSAGIALAILVGGIMALFSRADGLMLVINVVAGLVFGHLYLSLGGQTYATLAVVSFAAGIIAGVASAMVKGLTFLVILES